MMDINGAMWAAVAFVLCWRALAIAAHELFARRVVAADYEAAKTALAVLERRLAALEAEAQKARLREGFRK